MRQKLGQYKDRKIKRATTGLMEGTYRNKGKTLQRMAGRHQRLVSDSYNYIIYTAWFRISDSSKSRGMEAQRQRRQMCNGCNRGVSMHGLKSGGIIFIASAKCEPILVDWWLCPSGGAGVKPLVGESGAAFLLFTNQYFQQWSIYLQALGGWLATI
jgi:hypothetical protein